MPNVRIVDVATPHDFVRVVNNFSGAIMIFDGHGVRDPNHHTGAIVVGGKPMDLWLYREELRLPPIVLLSACDTFPIDGSHGSSAVSMLTVGAATVLGTLLPISAIKAAVTVGRLLLRIGEFLPEANRVQAHLNWRAFLSGLLRMSHVTEIILQAMMGTKLTYAEFEEIQFPANILINDRASNWSTQVEDIVRRVAPTSAACAPPSARLLCQLSDTMKYVQLGHSELIQIVPDDWAKRRVQP